MNRELWHYGTPRHSGRYPWGSGDNPYQRNGGFLSSVHALKAQGKSETQIARMMGMNTRTLREQISRANSEKRSYEVAEALRLKEKGLSNTAIAERMGKNESSIRSLLNPVIEERNKSTKKNAELLKDAVAEFGYIDVGGGVEEHLGITANRLKNAVALLKEEGYSVEDIKIEQMGTGKLTTVHVLAAPGTTQKDIWQNRDQITLPVGYSEDGGVTTRPFEPPKSVDSSRLDIRYAEDGGLNKDGVIELRRGVDDISLGNANYAQVRIAVDGTHYLKGMAVYSDDLPDGIDIRFNTNKTKDVAKMDVLKKMKTDDPENPFGASIKPEDKLMLAQKHYIDKDGNEQLSAINIVNEEGDWNNWGKTLSSQFLSKQSPALAKQQLTLNENIAKEELNDILNLTNPVVKTKLLEEFADKCDADAAHLQAASLPRQSTKVILPVTSLKDNEVYAPGYQDGEELVLVRFPHAGTFEIPRLKVNNRNPEAKAVMGDAIDAVGINHTVAEKLSGADFDGDHVVLIPTSGVNIKTSSSLPGLVGFDPKDGRYKKYDGMHVMTDMEKGIQMGQVSNLITDMTIKGNFTPDEMARAVRHSMVVIDAQKHELNYKLSEQMENIDELRRKYQQKDNGRYGGASTLISKAEASVDVPDRREKSGARIQREIEDLTKKGTPSAEDKATLKRLQGELDAWTRGEKVYEDTGKTKRIGKKQDDGTWENKIVDRTQKSNRMTEAKDAYELVSRAKDGTTTRIESVYADYANGMKDLARQARAASRSTEDPDYSPSMAKTYAAEVARLKAALKEARKNAPLERQAQLIANKNAAARIRDNPGLDAEHKKRVRAQELDRARKKVGSGKKTIYISDNEWKAINSGAVTKSFFKEILDNADQDRVRQLATPRSERGMSSAKVARAKSMLKKGYTQAEVANMLDISVSTLVNAVGVGNMKSN